MIKPLIASLFVLSVASASATTITENFASNPLAHGWKIFGDTNSFVWNSASHNLAVTWDSRRTNSYFYQPLGTIPRVVRSYFVTRRPLLVDL